MIGCVVEYKLNCGRDVSILSAYAFSSTLALPKVVNREIEAC